MDKIVIVNFGMGNLASIQNMIKKVGGESVISSDADTILSADKLILPGVGAFDQGVNNLKKLNLIEVLNKKVLEEKIPILGICLGMQLMTFKSEEGNEEGLKWIDGYFNRFPKEIDQKKLRVPHMEWNFIQIKKESKLMQGIDGKSRFYFVHSYYGTLNDSQAILCKTDYGQSFVSAFEKDNVFGVQFHPEKSHKFGMQFFKNFIAL